MTQALERIIRHAAASGPLDDEAVAGLAERAKAARDAEIVESCREHAEHDYLEPHVWLSGGKGGCPPTRVHFAPLAHVPRPLTEAAAKALTESLCGTCDPDSRSCTPGGCAWCGSEPPIGVAYTRLIDGSTEYVLASAECEACVGLGYIVSHQKPDPPCDDCSGTGAQTDLGPIVERCGGTVDEDDPRLARFVVRS